MKAVILDALANALGLFILSSVAFLGVGALLMSFSYFFITLKIIGAIYLIYLGVKLFIKKEFELKVSHLAKSKNIDYFKVTKQAFLVAVTNPKPILFFTAIFPLFMSPKYSLIGQFFIMTGTFLAISITSLITYGYIANKFSNFFSSTRSLNIFNKITGAIFVAMGGALALYSKKAN